MDLRIIAGVAALPLALHTPIGLTNLAQAVASGADKALGGINGSADSAPFNRGSTTNSGHSLDADSIEHVVAVSALITLTGLPDLVPLLADRTLPIEREKHPLLGLWVEIPVSFALRAPEVPVAGGAVVGVFTPTGTAPVLVPVAVRALVVHSGLVFDEAVGAGLAATLQGVIPVDALGTAWEEICAFEALSSGLVGVGVPGVAEVAVGGGGGAVGAVGSMGGFPAIDAGVVVLAKPGFVPWANFDVVQDALTLFFLALSLASLLVEGD